MFCQKCNSGPYSDGRFCATCGAPLEDKSVITQSSDMPEQTPDTPNHAPVQPTEPSPQTDITQPIETLSQPDFTQSAEPPAQPNFAQPIETPVQTEPAQTVYPQQHGYGYPTSQQSPAQADPAQPAYPQQHGYGYPPSPQAPDQGGGAEPIGAHPQYPAQPAYPQQHGYGYPTSQQAYPQADPSQAAYNPYGYYPPPPPAEKPKKKLWKILVPVAGALVLLIGVAVALFLIMRGSPAAVVARALANTGNELSERVEDTPLELFGMLVESLTDGSTTVGFEYNDRWNDSSGLITLHSDENQGKYLMNLEITSYGTTADIDMYMTRDSIAARIHQFDDNFYGIHFDTFADDFRSFATLLDLDRQQIQEIIDVIDMYHNMMNMTDEADAFIAELGQVLINALDRAEVNLESVDFTSDGSNIRARRIEFAFSYSLVLDTLEEFIDVLEESEYFRASFDAQDSLQSFTNPWHTGDSFNNMIREARRELSSMQRSSEGEFVALMYIDRSDRLLRIELNADFEVDRDQTQFEMSIDFGTSARDTWVLEVNVFDNFSNTTHLVEWEVNETSRGGETILRIIEENRRGGSSTNELILNWTDRGDFTLSTENEWGHETLLTGVYTSDGEGFNLTIDNPFTGSTWDEYLHLEISTARRSETIEEVDFISISEWDLSFIEDLEDFIWSFGMDDLPDFGELPALPEVPPSPPSPDVDPEVANSGLIGVWEFSHGRPTYFFWESEFVYFAESGFVMADDSFGDWSIDGNTLTVIDTFSNTHEVFTFEITGDILAITDRDNDTGYFVFLFD